MSEQQVYETPEEWYQLLDSTEKELSLLPGWQQFKERCGLILDQMNIDPMTREQSMVFIFYSRVFEDPEWSLDQVREDPTEEEEEEDFNLFKQALRRLVNAAPELLSDYGEESAEVAIEVGKERYSYSVTSDLLDRDQTLANSREIASGRLVMGYQLPSGMVEKSDSDHTVLGGWMTQDAWDKVRFDRENELTPEERESFYRWRRHYQESQSNRDRVARDESDLKEWVMNMLSADPNLVTPGPTQTVYTRSDFGLQCFLLHMLPRLSRRPSWMSIEDWVVSELGLNTLDDLYPVVTSEGRLFQLDDLIFNFGYGPNYFDWSKPKPYKLKGTPTTLYLIAMDVGRIANRDSAVVWKIGITQKDVTGTSASAARFHGKVGENVRVIREKRYKDGRDAFMIEQTVIQMSHQETFYDRERLGIKYETSRAFEMLESLDGQTISQLGYSEWIYPCKTEEEVASIYERMTSYGEFYGDGNVAYSVFKRDFEKRQ
jgi:hypothetical protein